MFNFKDSNELLDHAFRQVEETLNKGERFVEIALGEFSDSNEKSNEKDILEVANKLGIKFITEGLRKKYSCYDIKSRVFESSGVNQIISFERGCNFNSKHSFKWELTFSKKQAKS